MLVYSRLANIFQSDSPFDMRTYVITLQRLTPVKKVFIKNVLRERLNANMRLMQTWFMTKYSK